MSIAMHELRQPGPTRMIFGGETYYRYAPGPNGQCTCPLCVKAEQQRKDTQQ